MGIAQAKAQPRMTELQALRGMRDLLPSDMRRHRRVVNIAHDVALRYGFEEMATPLLETVDVFSRTLGDSSDVVMKEMYSFTDKGGEVICLRPENTAGVMRAVASNGLTQSLPLKFFYAGPMFRYERPQKGRLRQFHQIGTELIGPANPIADCEIIACGYAILRELGLADKIVLHLNSLGNDQSRLSFRQALVNYFTPHQAQLSFDSRERLARNPLRILDSKDDGDRELLINAPRFQDYLDVESLDFFARVQDGLTALTIPYRIDDSLVRGLDYYSHTAFEFITSQLGAQGTVMGGGRYDGLASQMGMTPLAAVGWAAGIERLAMLLGELESPARPLHIVPMGEAAERTALTLADSLRQAGWRVEGAYQGNMSKRLKYAAKAAASHALLLGEEELANQTIIVRNLDTSQQISLKLSDLMAWLAVNAGKDSVNSSPPASAKGG